ncbi:MAG: DUF1320 domain-containing protein [Desulfobacterales bacterium]|nr:DUF1320 domain-containing protein [Desulfobacterales bacterium]
MPYSTQSDILDQIDETTLVSLTDDAGTGSVDDDVVTRAIADADAEIDGYCGKKYEVPFSPVPDLIRKFSVVIAIKNLFARRRGAPDSRRQDYEDAIKFLKEVSKGNATLGEDDPADVPQSSHAPEIESADRIFDRDSLKNW